MQSDNMLFSCPANEGLAVVSILQLRMHNHARSENYIKANFFDFCDQVWPILSDNACSTPIKFILKQNYFDCMHESSILSLNIQI